MQSMNLLATGGASLSILFLIGCWLRARRRKAALLALRGKVVLITGASSGLGEACAHVFYRAGCKLILCARRTNQLTRLVDDLSRLCLKEQTFDPKILSLDVSQFSLIPAAIQTAISYHGSIDILINNAGVSFHGKIESSPLEVDISVMNVNYFGAVAITKALLPSMIERRIGHIVAISSVQGKLAIPFRSAYGASKFAMQSFFDCLRAEVSDRGIYVTVISPGYINTNLSLNSLKEDGTKSGIMDDELRNGMKPDFVAMRILESVASRENDVLIAPFIHRIAAYLKNLLPNIFCAIMAVRARKQRLKYE